MGLTKKNIGISVLGDGFKIDKIEDRDKIKALCGNPRGQKHGVQQPYGLRTTYRQLAGQNRRQRAEYKYKDNRFIMVDLPEPIPLCRSLKRK